MAAIDPSATPFNEKEPKRATLKLLRRPIDPDEFMNDDYEDSDEESEEDSDNEEDGGKESGGTSKAKKQADAAIKKALKVAEANAMEVDPKKGLNEDEDEDSDDDDDDELEIEEFVICTLDAENVSPGPCGGKARPVDRLSIINKPSTSSSGRRKRPTLRSLVTTRSLLRATMLFLPIRICRATTITLRTTKRTATSTSRLVKTIWWACSTSWMTSPTSLTMSTPLASPRSTLMMTRRRGRS